MSASRLPRPGETAWLGRAASVQFAGAAAFPLRVIRILDWSTYHGWVWVDGYALDPVTGDAVTARRVFVQVDGLPAWRAPTPRGARSRRD